MQICVVGTGYVGLVTAACFADLGHTVIGVDIDEEKVRRLSAGKCTIFEPGLQELLERSLASGRLRFTTDILQGLPGSVAVFCAVATPPNEDFSADVQTVFAVCEQVAEHAEQDIVFVNKSTVPVGTGKECAERIANILTKKNSELHIPVISNPEFLREGTAVQDTLHPDRIVVGINGDDWAKEIIEDLYQPLTRTGRPLLFVSRESAELAKYACNSFLATKISFINMMSEFCEHSGANVREIAACMGEDERIGSCFLQAGVGYGGSCFPKDVKALMAMSREFGVPLPLVSATHEINEHQRRRFFTAILKMLPEKATVGIWGLSFKPNTDDLREAPSLDLIKALTDAGHVVQVFDPEAMQNAKSVLTMDIVFADSPLTAAENTDVIVLLTEWDVFRGIDMAKLKETMKGDVFFDGRNIYDPKEVQEAGLRYFGIGVS